jgi:hypothetical protein
MHFGFIYAYKLSVANFEMYCILNAAESEILIYTHQTKKKKKKLKPNFGKKIVNQFLNIKDVYVPC